MHTLKNTVFAIVSISIVMVASHTNALINATATSVPPDFHLVISSTGVALYRKDYPGGNPDFVQIINLKNGASVKLLHGKIVNSGAGQGVFGGNDPTISRQSLGQAWNDFSSSNSNAFCITNGQFFSTNEDPTKLAFSLKKDGSIISDGYGSHGNIEEYKNPNQKLILQIWGDRADITSLTKDALYSSSAPNIIAGLTEDADKGPKNSTGRTFVGVDDGNSDGQYEMILIFNSKTATQPDAASILKSFGADKIVMLDGGSSTQLICQGTSYIQSSRTIPQTLAVVSGVPSLPADFWQKLKRQIEEWWKKQQAELEKHLKEWLEELERQFIIQLCGSATLPGVVAAWWIRRKKQ